MAQYQHFTVFCRAFALQDVVLEKTEAHYILCLYNILPIYDFASEKTKKTRKKRALFLKKSKKNPEGLGLPENTDVVAGGDRLV